MAYERRHADDTQDNVLVQASIVVGLSKLVQTRMRSLDLAIELRSFGRRHKPWPRMFPKWNSSWLVSDQAHLSIDRSYVIPHRRVQNAGRRCTAPRRSHAFVFVIYIYIIVDI